MTNSQNFWFHFHQPIFPTLLQVRPGQIKETCFSRILQARCRFRSTVNSSKAVKSEIKFNSEMKWNLTGNYKQTTKQQNGQLLENRLGETGQAKQKNQQKQDF